MKSSLFSKQTNKQKKKKKKKEKKKNQQIEYKVIKFSLTLLSIYTWEHSRMYNLNSKPIDREDTRGSVLINVLTRLPKNVTVSRKVALKRSKQSVSVS